LLRNIAAGDIARGDGLLLLDPHGPLAEELLSLIDPSRVDHVCYFDLSETGRDFPVGFNVLADVHIDDQALVAEGLVSAFRAVWGSLSWGPQLEQLLRHGAIVLAATPRASLMHMSRLLTDDAFRAWALSWRRRT
jgi:hypothetical protein